MKPSTLLLCALAFSGCGPSDVAEVEAPAPDEADTAASGLAKDSADRSCQVLLRHVERVSDGRGGYQVACNRDGVCFYVWQGVVDVATAARTTGSKVYVQYRAIDARSWSRKQAAMAPGGPQGFQRYTFRLEANTLGPGMSPTSLQRARIDLLPYLQSADGSRLFDHNRVTQDFDSYALVANNQWSVPEDGAACRPASASRGVAEFRAGWTQVQHGPFLAGGTGEIDYALERLGSCRGTHNGYPAWDITARVRFEPMGTVVEQSVRGFDAPNGVPDVSTLHPVPFVFRIPQGTQRLSVWFENNGLWCGPAFDSNQGANYSFPVATATPPAVRWVGNGGSSFARDCSARPGIPEPMVLDGYVRERACSFLELEAWAPGLTDGDGDLATLAARAELALDGKALPAQWLAPVGRVGNNWRYRFELPRDLLWYGAKWSALSVTAAFSTDGVTWVKDAARTVKRDPSWCNPSWGSCQ